MLILNDLIDGEKKFYNINKSLSRKLLSSSLTVG
jgi:hypothetical protein